MSKLQFRDYRIWSDVEVGRMWLRRFDQGDPMLMGDLCPITFQMELDRKTMLALRRALNKALAPQRKGKK